MPNDNSTSPDADPRVPRIRVLVVDDSRVVRRVLCGMLGQASDIEVVGEASNGRIALELLDSVRPDVVTLDVEMPELDGLETLVLLRRSHSRLPVLMVSALTEYAAAVTLEAIARGADDYVSKPSGLAPTSNLGDIQAELVRKVRALARIARGPRVSGPPLPGGSYDTRPSPGGRAASSATPRPARIVAIAASLGGPNALHALVQGLPVDLPASVLIVQHMPPVFTRLFAERLDKVTPLRVREAVSGEIVAPGDVWIAPGDLHLEVVLRGGRMELSTHKGEPENSSRPAADVLFRSIAASYGPSALGVVLTGMGHDGLRGAECIKAAGGQVLVQDASSSVVWSMPGAIARANLADAVLTLDQLAAEIARRTHGSRGGRWPGSAS